MKNLHALRVLLLATVFVATTSFAAGSDEKSSENLEPKPGFISNIFSPVAKPFQVIGGECWGGCKNTGKMASELVRPGEGSRFATIKELKNFWYGIGAVLAVQYISEHWNELKESLGLGEDTVIREAAPLAEQWSDETDLIVADEEDEDGDYIDDSAAQELVRKTVALAKKLSDVSDLSAVDEEEDDCGCDDNEDDSCDLDAEEEEDCGCGHDDEDDAMDVE